MVLLQGRDRLLVRVKFVLWDLDRAETLIFLVAILNEVSELIDGLVVKACPDAISSIFLNILPTRTGIKRSGRVSVDASKTDTPLWASISLQRWLLSLLIYWSILAWLRMLVGDWWFLLARYWCLIVGLVLISKVMQGNVACLVRLAKRWGCLLLLRWGAFLEWATRAILVKLLKALFSTLRTVRWLVTASHFTRLLCFESNLLSKFLQIIEFILKVELITDHFAEEGVELVTKLISLSRVLTVYKLLDFTSEAI